MALVAVLVWASLTSEALDAAVFNVTPGTNLQGVINTAAANGDPSNTLLFGAGTYSITSPLTVGAPFAGRTLEFKSSSGPVATILDGGGTSRIIWAQTGASSGTVIIDGLTLRNASATASFGGAVSSSWVKIVIRSSILSNNSAENNGAAIAIAGNNDLSQVNTVLLEVDDCDFVDNTSDGDGGAVQISKTSASIQHSLFERNKATGLTNGQGNPPRGAGAATLITQGGTLSVDGGEFLTNEAEFAGGAISVFDSSATIANATFTGNEAIRDFADPINKGDGGALHCETEDHAGAPAKSFVINNNTITANTAKGKGGGIHVFAGTTASTVTITKNIIRNNTAEKGGGIGNFDLVGGTSVQTVADNVIDGNQASDQFGGVILANVGDIDFRDNDVTANIATINNPGLYVEGADCTLILRNKFLDNQNNGAAGFLDGALRLKDLGACPGSSSALIENNFFSGNTGGQATAALIGGQPTDVVGNSFHGNHLSASGAGDIWTESSGDIYNNIFAQVTGAYGIRIKESTGTISVVVSYNDFFQNQLGLVLDPDDKLGGTSPYTTVAGLNAAGMASSNQDVDPLFVDPGNGDLHLQANSPIIDDGNCTFFSLPKTDIDGDTRPKGVDCEIGADELVAFVLSVDGIGSGMGTITSSPPGISCGGDCDEAYLAGSQVTLVPTPDPNSAFAGWSGDADCADGQVTMNSDLSCTATFLLLRTLSVSLLGSGAGTITSSPSGIDCPGDCSEEYVEGTGVDLTAVPDYLSEFAGYGGVADCSDGSLAMNVDTACTATFDPCSIASEVNLPPQNVSGSPNDFEACNRLTAGAGAGGFNILAGATATFRAGNDIVLENGFTIADGATFTAIIGPPPP